MADDARQSLPDLDKVGPDRTEDLSQSFDFFELLRRLERRGGLFGYSGRLEREPARLGQHVRLSFSARDVVDFQEA
ncbi:MAG: type VI secretion system baseplate subunit TssG, partial [Mesorhizobium sp.]